MAISVQCTACGKRYQAADHMAGRRMRCKQCGQTFQLPAQPTSDDPFEQNDAPVPVAASVLDNGEDDDGESLAPVASPPARRTPAAAAPEDPFGDRPYDPNAEVDAVFDDAFQGEYTPSRGNTPFVFPGSRELDRWLPHVLVVICLLLLARQTLGANYGEPAWVGPVRLLLLLMTFCGIVFPICLKGVRLAARKLNYELPSRAPWRAFATFLLPATIGCAVWLSSGSIPGLIFGLVMGLIVALPVQWLLFRIRTDDAPVSLGYGAAGFGAAVLASALVLSILNLILVGTVQATNSQHTLTMSPFGPGFTWRGPTIVEKKRPIAKPAQTTRGVPVAPTTKAFTDAVQDDAATRPAGQDLAASLPTNVVPAVPVPTDAAAIRVAEAQQATADKQSETQLNASATEVKAPEYGPVVSQVTKRLSGKMSRILHPLLPGRAVAAVGQPQPQQDRVELWSTADWAHKKAVTFSVQGGGGGADNYQLNSDGTFLARVADFPYPSAQVYSFQQDALMRPFIKLAPGGVRPQLAGFAAPNQLIMLFPGDKSAIEIWDVNRIKRLQRIEVGELRMEPGNYSVSRDGKLIALLIRDRVAGERTGRLEVYNLASGELTRRINIDELAWDEQVRAAGMGFTDENDKIAVLFERQGQGLFLYWGANDNIPAHQHVYPGGLLPDGVQIGAFTGQSFSLVDDGRAWLLYGASVFDTDTGRLLGDLGIKDVRSQKVLSRDTVLLSQDIGGGELALLEVRLDVARVRREAAKN